MIKHLITASALVGALLVATAAHADGTAYENFPLERHNLWVFITDSEGYLVGDTDTRTVEVTREWYLGFGWYANRLVGLLSPLSSVILYDHIAGSKLWAHDGSSWSTALRFGADFHAPWSFRADACDNYDVERVDFGSATIEEPAGVFSDVSEFLFKWLPDPAVKCAGPGIRSLTTVPGIGPVGFTTDEYKAHLMYARLDDTVVAAAPNAVRTLDGVETTLLVAEDELVHPEIVCITTPCVGPAAQLNVAFVVRNVGSEPRTFHFADGQAFEIDLWVGDVNVRRYSDGRLFVAHTWDFTLAPGESRVLSGHMPLSRFDDSTPLVGKVQVVGFLHNTEGSGKLDVFVHGRF